MIVSGGNTWGRASTTNGMERSCHECIQIRRSALRTAFPMLSGREIQSVNCHLLNTGRRPERP